jgi:hypothetical protein
MPEFNWNKMPDDLRRGLLLIADMDPDLSTVKWCGMLEAERKALQAALCKKTNGQSTLLDICP